MRARDIPLEDRTGHVVPLCAIVGRLNPAPSLRDPGHAGLRCLPLLWLGASRYLTLHRGFLGGIQDIANAGLRPIIALGLPGLLGDGDVCVAASDAVSVAGCVVGADFALR